MKKVKDYIKKNPEPAKGRFGVDPHDPWSAKYNMAEDLTTKHKGAGDSRSKVSHSPTQQRAAELDKAAKFYQVKNPTGTMGSKVHHEEKHMKKKEGNQNTLLTPESVQKCNESPAGKMCEVHGMKACKKINEAKKKMSALDKWRQASYDREKAHKEFMKSIEHLPHHDQMQKMMDKIKSDRASVHKEEVRGELKQIRNKESKIYNKEVDAFNKKVKEIHAEETITEISAKRLLGYMMKAGSKKDPKKGIKDRSKNTLKATGKYLKKIDEEELNELETNTMISALAKRTAQGQTDKAAKIRAKIKQTASKQRVHDADNAALAASRGDLGHSKSHEGEYVYRKAEKAKAANKKPGLLSRLFKKEEVEQIEELNKDTLKDYLNKSAETRKSAKSDLKTIEKRPEIYKDNTGKHQEKLATQAKKLSSTISKRTTGINRAFKKLHSTTEETYMDAKAATPAPMAPGEGISEKMTTAQRVMMLKKKKLKEDMHDHEKEDKSVATYGKKPKFEKAEKDEGGEKKPQAAAVMSGGTTLTGSKRDIVEIDPMMRNRPGQPDVTKKDDKKDDKDKDKKKDK